jgi:hypothetical protein
LLPTHRSCATSTSSYFPFPAARSGSRDSCGVIDLYILYTPKATYANLDYVTMADLQHRKVFKVFSQDFVVDERYNVTKELGQGAYGIVWYVPHGYGSSYGFMISTSVLTALFDAQCCDECSDQRRSSHQEGDECLQQKDSGQASSKRAQATAAFPRSSQRMFTVCSTVYIIADVDARSHAFTTWISRSRIATTRCIYMRVSARWSNYRKPNKLTVPQNSWNVIWPPSLGLASH